MYDKTYDPYPDHNPYEEPQKKKSFWKRMLTYGLPQRSALVNPGAATVMQQPSQYGTQDRPSPYADYDFGQTMGSLGADIWRAF